MIGAIELPWPVKELSPNARVHWAVKASAAKSARKNAAWATRAAGLSKLDLASLKVTVVYHAPDKRRRDADGVLSSCKAYLDGVADVIGVDDSNFELAIRKGAPITHGAIRILLECV